MYKIAFFVTKMTKGCNSFESMHNHIFCQQTYFQCTYSVWHIFSTQNVLQLLCLCPSYVTLPHIKVSFISCQADMSVVLLIRK